MVVKIRLLTWVHIKELLPGISPGEKTELQGSGVSGGCLKAVWRVSGGVYWILDVLLVNEWVGGVYVTYMLLPL